MNNDSGRTSLEIWRLNSVKKYKIIFSDIDGTLLNDENQVPKETVEELQSLDKRGIPFVLVSARMPEGMRPIREELGIHAPMVCYSGGLVLGADNEEIYSCLMDLDLACEIKNLVEKEFPQVVCGTYGGEHWVVDDGSDPWVLREQEITHLVPETGDIREIFGKTGGIHKFLFMGEQESVIRTEKRLKELYPELSIARSKPVYLEVMNGNVCKSAGVKIVCGKYNISLEQAMSFGDGQNDLDMLNAVGAGFAMANAPEEVKLAVPFVTPADNQHQGLLAVLRKYFATNIY
jgi:Cof subfamily protein (haloacid dehalogenase superfamily)